MRRYEDYRTSDASWIHQIPKHWNIRKMKFSFKERSEKNHPDEIKLSATQSHGVIPQSMYEDKGNHVVDVNKNFDGLKLVKVGDFVIHLRSFQGGIAYAYYQGIISAAYTILYPLEAEYGKYYKYLFTSNPYIQLLKTCVTGIREGKNIDYNILGNKYIPIPPIDEQEAIVEYLDSKTSKIDSYVAERERELQSLEELKQAEIAHIVTHGLNPAVPMRDSGIPWLGKIPAHWKTEKINAHFKERRVKVSDKDYPALSVAKIGVVPQLEDAVKTDNGDNRKLVKQGDFVVNSRSDRKGSCGVAPQDGSVSLINIVLEIIDMDRDYVHFLFRSNNYIEEFYRNGRGIVADLWTTRYSEMKNIIIPVPPIEEQKAIVDYINAKTSKIDSLIADLTAQIEKLKEYKQRLIADVVTGQIDVRK